VNFIGLVLLSAGVAVLAFYAFSEFLDLVQEEYNKKLQERNERMLREEIEYYSPLGDPMIFEDPRFSKGKGWQ